MEAFYLTAAKVSFSNHELVSWTSEWSDAERDFVRALYGHLWIVVADGVDQLVRRQTTCDWNFGVPENERVSHHLNTSLRKLRNVATFANCFSRALGVDTWRIDPQADLAGGRVIVAIGDVDAARLLPAMIAAADEQRAAAADLPRLPAAPRGKDDFPRENRTIHSGGCGDRRLDLGRNAPRKS